MKIASQKATSIAMPLYLKFMIEAKKLGYEFGDSVFYDIQNHQEDKDPYWQELISLYKRFIAKLKQEFSKKGILSWRYIGKRGIVFANAQKAVNEYFYPTDKGVSIFWDSKTGKWSASICNSGTSIFAPETTLKEVAKEYGEDFEKLFMEILSDYAPEPAGVTTIKLNAFLQIKREVFTGSLHSYLCEEITRMGPYVCDSHNLRNTVDRVIFMERYKSLEAVTF